MPPEDASPRPGEVYFEFIALGTTVKVCAVDAATGTEVSIIGPRSAARSELERVALAKLSYVMGKAEQPTPKGARRV